MALRACWEAGDPGDPGDGRDERTGKQGQPGTPLDRNKTDGELIAGKWEQRKEK